MGESRAPRFVICHLCGRKYGSKSIAIHAPQCQQKWEAENKKLPKQLRRSMPAQPDYSTLQSGNCSPDTVEKINQQAFESSQAQLIPCRNCGRTFYPEKLSIHQRSCTVNQPSRPPPMVRKQNTVIHSKNINKTTPLLRNNNRRPVGKTKEKSKENSGSTILCSICMKQIPEGRIEIHLVCCNQEKVRQIQHKKFSKKRFP